jgi:hypothetical protein
LGGPLSAQLSNSLAQAQHQYDMSSLAEAAKHLLPHAGGLLL